jgi:transcriptional regulator of arginine metabolism
MKFQRQSLILKLIEDESIETQKELSDKLKAAGFDVTQATISRDIKELRIVKVLDHDDKYRYAAAASDGMSDFTVRFRNIFRESVVNVDYAGHMVVIKTLSGVANAAAIAIDAMNMPHIVGSLAGDDTIFLVMREEKHAAELCEDIKNMLK